MNTQEAIAKTNEYLKGTDYERYFSPRQPRFFIEAARSQSVDWKEPFTDSQCQAIARSVAKNMDSIDREVERDIETTAKTPKSQRVYVDDLLARAGDAAGVDFLRRPLFWNLCEKDKVIIYKERWKGRRDGDHFILPADRGKIYSALIAWANKFRDA